MHITISRRPNWRLRLRRWISHDPEMHHFIGLVVFLVFCALALAGLAVHNATPVPTSAQQEAVFQQAVRIANETGIAKDYNTGWKLQPEKGGEVYAKIPNP